MFLSIVIPVYNGAKDIVSCLDSIWLQELPKDEYEVICVDDCSKDETCLVVEEQMLLHSNLRLLRNSVNKRAGGSRNYGVIEAKGEYILFIDADDYFHDGGLRQAFDYQKQTRLDILMCDFARNTETDRNDRLIHNFPNRGVVTGREFLLLNSFPWGPCKYFFKKDMMTLNNLFFEEFVSCEDVDWTHKMGLCAQTMQYQPILLSHVIIQPLSQTATDYKSPNTVFHRLQCGNRVGKLVEMCQTEQERGVILGVAGATLDVGVFFLNALFSSPVKKRDVIVENIDINIDWGRKLNWIRRNAMLYSVMSTLVSPLFISLLVIKRKFLGR